MPLEPMPGCSRLNRRLWRNIFGAIKEFSITSEIVLAIGKPSALAQLLLERHPHCTSMYDAMDDFPAFYSGLSRRALVRRERAIARLVDVVWTSSSELQAKWKRQHPEVRVVKNGLDLAGLPDLVSLSPSRKRAERVFGYVGTMGSWFDWSWVAALAQARPNDVIRLIGPVFERPRRALPDNVKLLPACEHAMALNAMLEFDVGLIPFRKNALTAAVDPIKYYEYRALGLPVISTDFGEMSHRADDLGVFISRNEYDAPELAELALHFESDPSLSEVFAKENSWATRFEAANLFP
jgi:glycosyltransferase involved in cell wall biosynthesis